MILYWLVKYDFHFILNDVEKCAVLKALKCRLSATIHVRKCLNGLLTYFDMRKITCFLINDLH